MNTGNIILLLALPTTTKRLMPSLPRNSQFIFLSLLFYFLHIPINGADYLFHSCSDSGSYAINSTFQSNLNHLLSSLSSTTPRTGFSNDTIGVSPDRIYGLALCRGDTSSDSCSSCISDASQNIVQQCPYYRGAVIWYDKCYIVYSVLNFLSKPEDPSSKYCLRLDAKVSDQERFERLVLKMMDEISRKAAFHSSSSMFATGEVIAATFSNLYGLVQCRRDLSGDQCFQCLRDSISLNCSYGQPVGNCLGVNCILMYDVTNFLEKPPSWVAEASSLDSPPPSTVPSIPPSAEAPPNENLKYAGKKGNKREAFTIAGITTVAVLMLISMIYMCIRRRNSLKKKSWEELHQISESRSLLFDLGTLKNATKNFSDANKIGQGGFGAVYKGTLPDGREIAVKRLLSSTQGIKQLRNEVVFIAKLQHKNLVRLLGCCLEKAEKLLVYEYIKNKSLDTYIFDDAKRNQLDWRNRYEIIRGIARGLLYLHQDSCLRLIHRDLKAGNILLDAAMNPKISDFGLARLVTGDNTQSKTSTPVGTYGYMAPEYAIHGEVSPKSDVFSFGVLVLEIVSGRSNNSFYDPNSVANLLTYAWNCWNNGTAMELMDPCLRENCSSHEVLRCIHIGLLCVAKQPKDRPNMSSVVFMLNRHKMKLQPPSQPAFFFETDTPEVDVLVGDNRSSNTEPTKISSNEVSITELDPR